MDSPFSIQRLISEGYSYLGMINEAQYKCLILKEKAQSLDFDQNTSIQDKLVQINNDIDKYSVKLMNLCNKLRENGAIL